MRPVPKADYPSLRKSERTHLGVLRERRDYLRSRLVFGDHSAGAGPFIAGEVSALEWALEQIDQQYGSAQVDGLSQDEMAVAMLESLCDSEKDAEQAHMHADNILLDSVSPEVRQAYEHVKRCSTFWVMA